MKLGNRDTFIKSFEDRNHVYWKSSPVVPSLGTKTTLRKVEDNVPLDADYSVGLPIASVLEIHERLKNSLYRYFIGKRQLPSPFSNGLYVITGKSKVLRK